MYWPERLVVACLLLGLFADDNSVRAAETKAKNPVATSRAQPSGQTAPKAGSPLSMSASAAIIPSGPQLRLLIYTTLIAVNQANQTGNYTVLQDMAAPGFREANNSARLTEIFRNLRQRNLDLSPVILLEPRLVRPPALMDNGMLRLSGYMPSSPEQVNFDLAFQQVEGRWLLFAVGVNTSYSGTVASGTATTESPDDRASVTTNAVSKKR
ncbi:hypothetical protein [Hyphomicrobium sp. 2TAF46]|uniref:hypothetical protein n=1 Tax=Hyphomicrobium sp. 2TAF46 TaxID=3233019 RepID=UPI003F93C82C